MPAAQAQKEAFVNEAMVRIDMLLQPTILAEQGDPPRGPDARRQLSGGSWRERGRQGQDASIAGWSGTQWIFVAPRSGMAVRDLSTGQVLVYDTAWLRVPEPEPPQGGAVIDAECRAALSAVIEALRTQGSFSSQATEP
ncbi:DUF2793 domain-containing protein [Qipengyuania sp. MTN3-11]|uniref:DUF2793 domain-containing protein n=1 Tax=Qipengyuania sp. MTN3-11 TaxID=3056557 RepID=UPI0036F3BC02